MRFMLILALELAISVFVTASLMPVILVTVPAAQADPRLGLGLMCVVCVLCLAVLLLVKPPWRR